MLNLTNKTKRGPKVLPDSIRSRETLIITQGGELNLTTTGHFRALRAFSPKKKLEEFLSLYPKNKSAYSFNLAMFLAWLEYDQNPRLIRRISYVQFDLGDSMFILPEETKFIRIPTPNISTRLEKKES